jgi:hypothetical protein
VFQTISGASVNTEQRCATTRLLLKHVYRSRTPLEQFIVSRAWLHNTSILPPTTIGKTNRQLVGEKTVRPHGTGNRGSNRAGSESPSRGFFFPHHSRYNVRFPHNSQSSPATSGPPLTSAIDSYMQVLNFRRSHRRAIVKSLKHQTHPMPDKSWLKVA